MLLRVKSLLRLQHRIWRGNISFHQYYSKNLTAVEYNQWYRIKTLTTLQRSPSTQSISRWIRSLILHWINAKSKKTIVQDLHAKNNLIELCEYLNGLNINDSFRGGAVPCRFETLELLHGTLLRDPKHLSMRDLTILLNSYTRLKSLFPKRDAEISGMALQLVNYLTCTLAYDLNPLVNVNEQDVSLLLNAMSKFGIRNKCVLKLLETLLVRPLDDGKLFIETFSPQGMSLVVNALQKFEWVLSPYLLITLSQFTTQMANKFTIKQLLVATHALWKLKLDYCYIEPLLLCLDKTLAATKQPIDLKILSLFLYTFGKLEHFPENSKNVIIKELNAVCNTDLDTYGMERENLLTNVIHGLSQLNWHIKCPLDKLFHLLMEKPLSTIGLATVIVSLSKLNYKPLIKIIEQFPNKSMLYCTKYYTLMHKLFQRITFTMELAKTPEFTTNSSCSLITIKQLSNILFTLVLCNNQNLQIYNYLIDSLATLGNPMCLNIKGLTQVTCILPFFCLNDRVILKFSLKSLRFLNQATKLMKLDENTRAFNQAFRKDTIKSSKTHISIASTTRKVVKQLNFNTRILVEHISIPYIIDIVVKL